MHRADALGRTIGSTLLRRLDAAGHPLSTRLALLEPIIAHNVKICRLTRWELRVLAGFSTEIRLHTFLYNLKPVLTTDSSPLPDLNRCSSYTSREYASIRRNQERDPKKHPRTSTCRSARQHRRPRDSLESGC